MIGALMTRPSVNATCIMSSENVTAIAKAVVGTKLRTLRRLLASTPVVIPSLQQFRVVLTNESFDLGQITCVKSAISSQGNGIQPKLGFISTCPHMYMRRFQVFVAPKVKSEPANA